MYPKMRVRLNANKGLVSLMNYSIENFDAIEEVSIETILDEIDENIKFSLNQEDPGYLNSDDIKVFIDYTDENGIAETIKNFIDEINSPEISSDKTKFLISLIRKMLKNFKEYIQICISNKFIKNYFDIINILYSTYKVSIIIILAITKTENREFKKILVVEILEILNTLILESSYNYKDMRFQFEDYLVTYCLILALMITKNENNLFKEIIEKWINLILHLARLENDEIKKSRKLSIDYLSKLYYFLDSIRNMTRKKMIDNEKNDVIDMELKKIRDKISEIQKVINFPSLNYISSFDDLPEETNKEIKNAVNLFFDRN
jgi:hypothetical protein